MLQIKKKKNQNIAGKKINYIQYIKHPLKRQNNIAADKTLDLCRAMKRL